MYIFELCLRRPLGIGTVEKKKDVVSCKHVNVHNGETPVAPLANPHRETNIKNTRKPVAQEIKVASYSYSCCMTHDRLYHVSRYKCRTGIKSCRGRNGIGGCKDQKGLKVRQGT